jgi:hypothetical protein
MPKGTPARVSTGLPKVTSEALAAPVGRRLVDEHPALRVAGEVDVESRSRSNPVDGVRDGEHMIGERALEAAGLALGGTEVDHPGIDSVLAQHRHAARRRRHVIDLGREHERGHEEDGWTGATLGEVAAQPVHALL